MGEGRGSYHEGNFYMGQNTCNTLGDGRYVVAGRLPCDRLAAEATDK